MLDIQNENKVINLKLKSLEGQDFVIYDLDKENTLSAIPVNFYARSVIQMNK